MFVGFLSGTAYKMSRSPNRTIVYSFIVNWTSDPLYYMGSFLNRHWYSEKILNTFITPSSSRRTRSYYKNTLIRRKYCCKHRLAWQHLLLAPVIKDVLAECNSNT